MNELQKAMKHIAASEELKSQTLQAIDSRREKSFFPLRRIAAAVAVLMICIGGFGYGIYQTPTSYISIDMNPSIELTLNCFGRVIGAEGYNDDGIQVLNEMSLTNQYYLTAVENLLTSEAFMRYKQEDSFLSVTVISDNSSDMQAAFEALDCYSAYESQYYESDIDCLHEAHHNQMSFGKYRACEELMEYDSSYVLSECQEMTMSQLHQHIEQCAGRQHQQGQSDSGHHKGHQGQH